MNIDQTILYFECSSRSLDKTCSLTLFAFFDSFLRIAEHTNPVTASILTFLNQATKLIIHTTIRSLKQKNNLNIFYAMFISND